MLRKLTGLFFTNTALNTFVVFFGNGLSAFFAFVFTVTAVREMSLSDFGYFSAMLSFLLLVSDLSDIGIGSTLSAFLPSLEKEMDKLHSFLKNAFFLQSYVAIVISFSLFLFSFQLSELFFHTGNLTWLMQLTSLGIFFTIIGNFFNYALSARQKFKKVAFLSAYSSILRVVFLVVLIYLSSVSLDSIAWLQVLTLLITAVTAFLFVRSGFLKATRIKGEVRKIISFAKYIGLARGLTAIASRLDVLMLVALMSPSQGPVEAGIYSIASRVISIYPLLAGSFSQVIAPKLSSIESKKDLHNFIKKVTFGTLGIISTVFIVILVAKPFLLILFTQKAEGAVVVFQLLLVSMVFFVASIPSVSMVIYYIRKPHILSVNSILQLLIVLIGNLIFIPRFGRVGPAYSLILAYGITLVTTTAWTIKSLREKHGK